MSNHIAKNSSIKLVLGHLSFEPFLSKHGAFASSHLNFIKQFVMQKHHVFVHDVKLHHGQA